MSANHPKTPPATPPATPPSTPVGAANAALDFVEDGMLLGLGTGRAAAAFVDALGARVADGLRVTGVPTSEATAEQATGLGIPLTRLEDVDRLDVTFDGADEVDPALNLIKGYGAAMVREKIVAASSNQLVILVGPEKLVATIGDRGRLPVEVLPFGEALVRRRLADLGLDASLRNAADGSVLLTDNGNHVLDVKLVPAHGAAAPLDADALELQLVSTPGVLGTGFFLGMADAVLIGSGEDVEIRRR